MAAELAAAPAAASAATTVDGTLAMLERPQARDEAELLLRLWCRVPGVAAARAAALARAVPMGALLRGDPAAAAALAAVAVAPRAAGRAPTALPAELVAALRRLPQDAALHPRLLAAASGLSDARAAAVLAAPDHALPRLLSYPAPALAMVRVPHGAGTQALGLARAERVLRLMSARLGQD